jgi:hypothetical protein
MPSHLCSFCNYSTDLKGNYKKHIQTKKHGVAIQKLQKKTEENGNVIQKEPKKGQKMAKKSQKEPKKSEKKLQILIQKEPKKSEKTTIQNSLICSFCEKSFSSISNRRRHELHRCKKNNNTTDLLLDEKNKLIKKLEKEKQEIYNNAEKDKVNLYKQISELIEKVGDTTINQTQNINLNNYGTEDISHIISNFKNRFLKLPYGAIPKMLEVIHFNDSKPENKNIVLPNKNENMVKIFMNNKWVYKDKNEAILDLVDKKYMLMDAQYELLDLKNNDDNYIEKTYTKFKSYYEDGDKELVDRLKKECEMVLLNNR